MIDPPAEISNIFCSRFNETLYLTFFDRARFLGRLQIVRNPGAHSWMRVRPIDLAEGEIEVGAMRHALPDGDTIVWNARPEYQGFDRLEISGTSSVWRLVLVSPVRVENPTGNDEVDAYTYLISLRAIIWT